MCRRERVNLGWWALFGVEYLHINVQKATLHYFKSEPHLHPGADSIKEALLCVRIHAYEVPAHGGKSQHQAQK